MFTFVNSDVYNCNLDVYRCKLDAGLDADAGTTVKYYGGFPPSLSGLPRRGCLGAERLGGYRVLVVVVGYASRLILGSLGVPPPLKKKL